MKTMLGSAVASLLETFASTDSAARRARQPIGTSARAGGGTQSAATRSSTGPQPLLPGAAEESADSAHESADSAPAAEVERAQLAAPNPPAPGPAPAVGRPVSPWLTSACRYSSGWAARAVSPPAWASAAKPRARRPRQSAAASPLRWSSKSVACSADEADGVLFELGCVRLSKGLGSLPVRPRRHVLFNTVCET